MSTAAPLPLEPLPPPSDAPAGQQALRAAAAERLQQHRRRRGDVRQTALPGMQPDAPAPRSPRMAASKPIADSVAARFAKSVSYRDYLEQEAESATRQAEAIAEIARRNAEAVAAAQQRLLDDIAQWDQDHFANAALPVEPAALLTMPSTQRVDSPMAHCELTVPAPASAVVPELSADEAVTKATSVEVLPAELTAEPPVAIPANLIEFPRQLVAARKARPRLAEGPLREDADEEHAQLRIFEVEASSFSTTPVVEPQSSLPEWSSIRLDSRIDMYDLTQPEAQVSLTLPVHAAAIERRVMAALVDGCCVGAAFVLAVGMAGLAGGILPAGLPAVGASLVTLAVLALGYLLLCFSLGEQTVGMRYARIALCTFGDDNPGRAAMRRRLFAVALSAGSLGLGFAWALLDDDKLGWHDRISRMYQRSY